MIVESEVSVFCATCVVVLSFGSVEGIPPKLKPPAVAALFELVVVVVAADGTTEVAALVFVVDPKENGELVLVAGLVEAAGAAKENPPVLGAAAGVVALSVVAVLPKENPDLFSCAGFDAPP